MTREQRRDIRKLYNPRTIAQLQVDYPYNDWLTYINSLLPSESQVQSTETVVVGDVAFFEKLGGLLKETSKRTLANYIAWRQVDDSMSYLPKVFKDRQFEFEKAYFGVIKPKSRSDGCITDALESYPFAMSGLYIRKHFGEDSKAEALEMVANIKEEFKVMLEENSWMDESTKEQAIGKAEAIHEVIGYPEGLMDDAKIIAYYKDLNVTFNETLYYESALAMQIAITKQADGRLRTPVDKKAWMPEMNPAVVNAAYSAWDNAIHFPAGILQDVFFKAKRPQYMNYGGIGLVIGHEITHGKNFC